MSNAEAFAVSSLLLRLTASPALTPRGLADLRRHLRAYGRDIFAVTDPDLSASVISVRLERAKWFDVGTGIARMLGAASAGRSFRIEFMSDDAALLPTSEEQSAIGKALEAALVAPVFVSPRDVRCAEWSRRRPFPWGRRGIAVVDDKGHVVTGKSDCLGASFVCGAPTTIYAVRLEDVSDAALLRAARAVGGPDAGYADVGAYATTSAVDGCPALVLELGDEKRAPLHRVLDVLDIECRRSGGRLGRGRLLSSISLESLLGTLRARMALDVQFGQVIETHLPGDGAEAVGGERSR